MNSELLFLRQQAPFLKRCMMDFDQFVSEYIAEDHDFEQLSVMVLEGCRVWYPPDRGSGKSKKLQR